MNNQTLVCTVWQLTTAINNNNMFTTKMFWWPCNLHVVALNRTVIRVTCTKTRNTGTLQITPFKKANPNHQKH